MRGTECIVLFGLSRVGVLFAFEVLVPDLSCAPFGPDLAFVLLEAEFCIASGSDVPRWFPEWSGER